ncbi:ankyrin repeat-containing domain protein [Mycena latifolia]|nr:ankyrin repeat-containing domain protein [Mycena latifolia]
MLEHPRGRASNFLQRLLRPRSSASSSLRAPSPSPTPVALTSISTPSAPPANDQPTVPAESPSTAHSSSSTLVTPLSISTPSAPSANDQPTVPAESPSTAHSQSSTPVTPLSISTPSAPSANDQPAIPAISISTADCAVDNLTLVFGLVQQVTNIVQKVPFIAPAAALMTELLKVYKEVKDTNEKRDVLLANIADLSRDLCGTVLRMEATNHVDLIGRLKADIQAYTGLLIKASAFIKDCNNHRLMSHIAARNELGTKFVALTRELDSFGARFRSNRLVDLVINQRVIAVTAEDTNITVMAEKLERWLDSPPDMKRKQSETLRLRKEGTGLWLLEGKMFQQWQDNPGSLWIQGNSGAGKSVLSSAIINKLGTFDQVFKELPAKNAPRSPPVAFFYFDFRNNEGNPVEMALRRIVLQLSAHSANPYRTLDKEYKQSSGQTLPMYQDLLKVLKELLKELGRTYIVLDALDECKEANLEELLGLLSVLRSWTQTPLHLLITSQPRSTLTQHFRNVPCLFLEAAVTGKDIYLFVAEELQKSAFKGWTSRADYIIKCIVHKSNGMFRLAACLLLEISRRWTNVGELDKMLDMLPNDLFGIYDRFIEAVHPDGLVYAIGVLRWIIFSSEEMTLSRLADAVAFDFSNPTQYIYEPNHRDGNKVAILRWLEGLVIANSSRVILAHASVQDYLLSKEFTAKFGYSLSANLSHSFIAQTCIHYFLHFSNHHLDGTSLHHYPLALYAADNWCQHLLLCHDPSMLFDSAMCLLEDGSKQYNALKLSHQGLKRFLDGPLQLCCYYGYIEGVRGLLTRGADVNEGRSLPPLEIAIRDGDLALVHVLLEHNANPNISDSPSALTRASRQGSTEIVRLLLQHGADVNVEDEEHRSALLAASKWGYPEVVQHLLQAGADVNVEDEEYRSPLQVASKCGYHEVVQLLLQAGADVNAKGGKYQSSLQKLRHRHHNSDVNMANYESALQVACTNGHTNVVRLLLQAGASMDIEGLWGGPLHTASEGGHTEIVQLLLENGADVNAKCLRGSGALQTASMKSQTEVVRLLLENGADVNAMCEGYGTALQAAARALSPSESIRTVQLLLDNGADVNAPGGRYGNALQTAASAFNPSIRTVQLLLDNGADVNATGGEYGSVLQAAACTLFPSIEIVQLLLENGADVNARGGKFGSALQAARRNGHTEIADILLAHGAVDTRVGVDTKSG